MGGGDLNQKKSWHPNTMKNMERVWKAEQKDTEEKKRIAELQREINAERSKEDIQKFAEDTGVVKKKDDIKLEWMYKGPTQSVNHEEYLLGKAVDKNFEKHQHELKNGPSTSQEEEGLPGAVRQAKGSIFSEQVDMVRKMQEDPLMAIRQRAVAKAKELYNNPVKMKQIQKLVSESKKHKKEKKKKKSKKSSKREEKEMLDALLTAKLKDALKDRNLFHKLKKKSRKNRNDSSSSSDGSESDESLKSPKHQKLDKLGRDHEAKVREVSKHETHHKRPYFPEDRRGRHDDNSYEQRNVRRASRSPRSSRRRSRSRSREKERDKHYSHRREQQHDSFQAEKTSRRNISPEAGSSRMKGMAKKYNTSNRSSSSSDDDRKTSAKKQRHGNNGLDNDRHSDSDDDSRSRTKRSFGLMMADGSKPVAQNRPATKEVKVQPQAQKTVPWQRKERVKLSDEEKERRRLEMLQNASWRDKEREENVKRYRIEEDREKKQLQENFDDDFARKQFSKAADQASVEERIKSKLNTIQRTKMAMDSNFARR